MMQATIIPVLRVHDVPAYLVFLERAFGARPGPNHTVEIEDSRLEVTEATSAHPPSRLALHAYVPDADAVYERALAAGAKSLKEPVDQPYGDREASIEDAAGNYWYIATHLEGAGSYRPPGLRTITPYFHIVGADEFIRFLEQTFSAVTRECHASPDGVVQHAKVAIGESMLELSEAHGAFQPMPAAIHVYLSDLEGRPAHIQDPFGNTWVLDQNI